MFAVCELYFIAYLHTFSRGELYGLQIELTRDLFDVCKTTTQRSKGCIAFHLTLIRLRLSALNPTIDQLPGRAVLLFSANSMSLARFLFWAISHVFV